MVISQPMPATVQGREPQRVSLSKRLRQPKDHSLSKGIINSKHWHCMPSTTGCSGAESLPFPLALGRCSWGDTTQGPQEQERQSFPGSEAASLLSNRGCSWPMTALFFHIPQDSRSGAKLLNHGSSEPHTHPALLECLPLIGSRGTAFKHVGPGITGDNIWLLSYSWHWTEVLSHRFRKRHRLSPHQEVSWHGWRNTTDGGEVRLRIYLYLSGLCCSAVRWGK